MANNTLIQMSKFDFNAPVITEMVFEDESDEENCSPSISISKIHKQNVDDTSSEVITVQESENGSDTNSANHFQMLNKAVDDCIVNYIAPEESKACKSPSNTSANKKVTRNKDKVKEKLSKKKSPRDKTTNETLPALGNRKASPNNKDLETMSSVLEKLKDNVSFYLVMIIRAYCIYKRAQFTGNNNWKDTYLQIKQYFFKLSYVVVDTLFIPQKNSNDFSRSFIENTVKIASEHSVKCTYEQVKPLYAELLEWTQKESKKIKSYAVCYKKVQSQQTKKNTTQQINQNKQTFVQGIDELLFENQKIISGPGIRCPVDLACDRTGPDRTEPPNVTIAPPQLPTYEENARMVQDKNNGQPPNYNDTERAQLNSMIRALYSERLPNGRILKPKDKSGQNRKR